MKNMRIACLAAAACVSVSCLNGVFAVQAASSVLPAEPQTEEQPLTDEILLPQELAQSQQDADNVRKDGTETEGAENAAASAKPADAEAPEAGAAVEAAGEEPAETEKEKTVDMAAEKQNLLPVEASDPESMQQYKDFSYYDPQWVTDEALFGVWDGAKWVPQELENGTKSGGTTRVEGPLLKYDLEKYASTMRPIEEAAKKGDYETCKALLLEHYRQKFALLGKMSGSTSRSTVIGAATLMYNLTGWSEGTDKPVEFLEAAGKEGWYSVDVTAPVKTIAADTVTDKGFLAKLIALRKDGYRAVFSSKEGAHTPYLEVELSDGTKKKFESKFDASMSAGSNMNTQYGTRPTLEVEESVSSVGKANNVDENTSRVYIQFPMKELTPQDEVRSAKIYLYGSTNGPDDYKKQIAVYKMGYKSTLAENSFNWNSLDHYVMSDDLEDAYDNTDTKYLEGKFFDTVYRGPGRCSGNIADSISLYLGTGNEEYDYHAIRTLLALCMDRGMLGNPKDTGIYWPYSSLLCLGNRGQIMQNRLRGLIDSKYMTPDVFACLLKLCWTTAEQLEYGWRINETTSNWGNTESTALFNMSLYFDEFEDCHKPLEDYDYQAGSNGKSGGWRALAAYRLILKGGEIMFPDGAVTEVPMGYSDYALGGFVSAFNTAESANMQDEFPEEIIDYMERIIEYLIYMGAPDGTGYSQGNSEDHKSTAALTRSKWLNNKTDNDLIRWYASGKKLGPAPKETSRIYPIGLKYISRSGWGDEGVGSHFNADGACNVHGHADDLTFDLFAYGDHLLVDNGVMDYSDSDIRAWQISTRAHNTIEINGVGQRTPKWSLSSVKKDPFTGETLYLPDESPVTKDADGNQINYDSLGHKYEPGYFMDTELNNGYDYVRGGTNNYKNRTLAAKNLKWNDYAYERSVFFVRPDFYLITDYLDPLTDKNEVNTYEQRWHTMPGVTVNIDETTGQARTSGQNASVIIAPVAQEEPLDATVESGYYTPATGSVMETQHALYTKKAAGTTTMNTVIYPVAPGKDFTVSTQNLELSVPESAASAFTATITNADTQDTEKVTKYEKHIERDTMKDQTFGSYVTDGYLAVVDETNGRLSMAAMQGGTKLNDAAGRSLILSKNRLEGFSVTWKNGQLELSTGKTVVHGKADVDPENEIDLDQLTVYAPNYINGVTLNGERISYKRAGSYIYFGTEPLRDDGEVPEPGDDNKPAAPSAPNHGSGGSGGGGSQNGSGENNNGSSSEPGQKEPDLYGEIAGHWAEKEIKDLVQRGIVKGDGTGLNLTGQVTRAEFAAMMIRVLGLEETEYQGGMQDVHAGDWCAGVIQTCMDHGILQGSGGMMRPDDPITREEMAKAAVSVSGKAIEGTSSFTDEDSISEWAKPFVDQAVALGLINGFEDGSFRPAESTLREQAMVVSYRLLHLE